MIIPLCTAIICLFSITQGNRRSEWEQKLRTDLKATTDFISPPGSHLDDRLPVEVTVGLNVYKISDIQIDKQIMEINAWLRLSWIDPRLTWNPSDYGGIEQTVFYGEPMEPDSEIWVPDLELYTQTSSVYEAARKGTRVRYDGSAFLSRPALFTILCSFTDVQLFPYDKPACTLDFGGWAQSGSIVNYIPGDLEFATTNAYVEARFEEFSARTSASEVSIASYYFDCCPNEPWPIISFKICAARSSNPYVRTIILPNILITLLSFVILWMDPSCGERLSYSATLLLSLVAVDFVTVTWIPKTNTVLWIEVLSSASLAGTVASAMLSIVCAYYGSKWSRELEKSARESEAADKEKNRRKSVVGMKDVKRRANLVRTSLASEGGDADDGDGSERDEKDVDVDLELDKDDGNGSDTEDEVRERRDSLVYLRRSSQEQLALEAQMELDYLHHYRYDISDKRGKEGVPKVLPKIQPVRFLGRRYLHFGKALDVYGRVVLPTIYIAVLAWLYAAILQDVDLTD